MSLINTSPYSTSSPVADGGDCCDGVTVTSNGKEDVPPLRTRFTATIPLRSVPVYVGSVNSTTRAEHKRISMLMNAPSVHYYNTVFALFTLIYNLAINSILCYETDTNTCQHRKEEFQYTVKYHGTKSSEND